MGEGTAGLSVAGSWWGAGVGRAEKQDQAGEVDWPWSPRALIQSVCGGGALMKREDEEQLGSCTLQRNALKGAGGGGGRKPVRRWPSNQASGNEV